MNLKEGIAVIVLSGLSSPLLAGSSAPACRDGQSMEKLAADRSLTSWEKGDAVPYAVNKYFLCEAVAKGDRSPCGALKPIPAQHGLPSSLAACKDFSGRILMSKALISRDGSFRKLCRKFGISSGEDHFSAADNDALCAIFQDSEKDPDGGGAKTMAIHMKYRGHLAGEGPAPCAEQIRTFWGLGEGCPALKAAKPEFKAGVHDLDSCLLYQAAADYRKAFAAHDPEACGTDLLCRAMMGGGSESCQGYAAEAGEAKKLFCSAASNPPETGK